MKLPSFQFYPGDWMKDPNLRRCSHAARGVWIDMLCLMFECSERGVLITGSSPWSREDVAAAVGGNADVTLRCIDECVAKGVCRLREDGALYCRRMVDEEAERRSGRERVRIFREKRKCNGRVTSFIEGEDEDRKKGKNTSDPQKQKIATPRPRNVLFDALASATGMDPFQVTKSGGSAIGTALAEIKAAFPNVTPEEIQRRAEAYRKLMPRATLTPTALAKHWAACVPGADQMPLLPRDYSKF